MQTTSSINTRQVVEAILARRDNHSGDPRASLLPVLRTLQEQLGYLPEEVFAELHERLGTPRHTAYSVASFYDDFRFERPAKHTIRVCDGAVCELGGRCRELLGTLSGQLNIRPGEVTADQRFRLEAVNCLGHCEVCPAVRIDDLVFGRVTASEVPELLRLASAGDDASRAAIWRRASSSDTFPATRPGQQLRLLGPEPRSLSEMSEWEAAGGFETLPKLIGQVSPQTLRAVIQESGLRGRGGAGFPVGKKWELAAAQPAPRVLVCNADESEPGTFKDRFLLAHRPLLLLEGMLLAGYAIGADRGVIYLRSDYAYLQPGLETCLAAMTAAGLLGEKIAGSRFSFHIEIHLGAGAYICGEESALIESLEGKRGEPRLRPPFPVESGLFGRPTVVNNVETLAYVPRILARGPAWFREVGTAQSPGTKLFSLCGDVACPGVHEMPLGTTLGELIDRPGGGMRGEFGFALLGGAAGHAVGPDQWQRPLDFEHGVGNGSVMVFRAGRSKAEVAANLLRFFSRETCGACLPCRGGVAEAQAILELSASRQLRPEERESLDRLADCLATTSRCGLGKTALVAAMELLDLDGRPK